MNTNVGVIVLAGITHAGVKYAPGPDVVMMPAADAKYHMERGRVSLVNEPKPITDETPQGTQSVDSEGTPNTHGTDVAPEAPTPVRRARRMKK